MYLSLMKEGYKLEEIDNMDLHFFLELMEFKANEQQEKPSEMSKAKKHGFIDQLVW